MGYRSDVAYTIRFVIQKSDEENLEFNQQKCKDSFFTFIAEAKTNEDTLNCFNEQEFLNAKEKYNQGFYLDEEDLTIKFCAWSVKWYPDYLDVKCHDALIKLAQEWAVDNEYIGGVFVRIGEEPDDNEEFTFGNGDFDWLHMSRQVVGDWL
jgi:hypothetical protein